MNNRILRYALLSASLMVGSAPAINANIPAMAEHFSNVPLSTVEMLTTMPSLFLMIAVLLSSFIARKIGYKQTIMIGLGMAAVAGVAPLLVDNIWIILVSRGMLGFGIGLFNSLLVSMINYFYEPGQRSAMYGLQTAFEGAGGITITLIAGQLVKINWQAPFYAYLITVPVFLVYLMLVPRPKTEDVLAVNAHKKNGEVTGHGHTLALAGNVFLLFVAAMLYMTYGIKIASLISTVGYGAPSDASFVIMFLSLGGIAAGIFFGKIIRVTKEYSATVGLGILAITMVLFSVSQSLILTFFGGLLSGIGFKIFMPALIDKINKSTVYNKSLATSLLLVGFNLGAFLSPYGSMVLAAIAGKSGLPGLFLVDGVCFGILTAITLLITIFKGRKTA